MSANSSQFNSPMPEGIFKEGFLEQMQAQFPEILDMIRAIWGTEALAVYLNGLKGLPPALREELRRMADMQPQQDDEPPQDDANDPVVQQATETRQEAQGNPSPVEAKTSLHPSYHMAAITAGEAQAPDMPLEDFISIDIALNLAPAAWPTGANRQTVLADTSRKNESTDNGNDNQPTLGGKGDDTLEGDNGDDRIIGGNGDDTLNGSAGDDHILGNGGNDLLVGGQGNDTLHGGAGWDTARMEGGMQEAAFSRQGNTWTITTPDGDVDSLNGIEQVACDNGVIYLDGRNNDPLPVFGQRTLSEDDSAQRIDLVATSWDFEGDSLSVADLKFSSGDAGGMRLENNQLVIDTSHYQYLAVGEISEVHCKFRIEDGQGGSAEGHYRILVTGANDLPTVQGAIHTDSSEDATPFILDLLAGALDVDASDTLAVSALLLVSGDDSGIHLVGNNLQVDPAAYNHLALGETSEVSYRYTLSDGHGGAVEQTATITIRGENDVPGVTSSLSATTSEDALPFTLDLLAGAFDADANDRLAIRNVQGLAEGLTLNGTGLLVDPNAHNHLSAGEVAEVRLQYEVIDGHGGEVAQTATITIRGENDAPTVSIIDAGQVSEEDAPLSINLLATAQDVDRGDVLSVDNVQVRSNNEVRSVSYTVDHSTGQLVIDPNQFDDLRTGEHESVAIEYQVTDSKGGTVTNTALLMVNGVTDNAPVLDVGVKGFRAVGGEYSVNNAVVNPHDDAVATAAWGDGGYVVIWSAGPFSTEHMYGQKYDSAGNEVGDVLRINSTPIDGMFSQSNTADVCALDNGGFIVTWSVNPVGLGYDIYAQLFDISGQAVGAEIVVTKEPGYHSNYDPHVTQMADGGYIITWTGDEPNYFDSLGIYGQRFDTNGTTIGSPFHVNSFTYGLQDNSDIDALAGGGFVVTWISLYQDGDFTGVFGQRFSDNGEPVGDEFQVNTYTRSYQHQCSVAGLNDGGFVVTWRSDFQSGIYAQRYDENGAVIGSEFKVNSDPYQGKYNPDITALKDGGFIITWEDTNLDGSGNGIFGQRYDASGQWFGENFLMNTTTYHHQQDPSVTALDDGGFVVVWESYLYSDWGYSVQGQRYTDDMSEIQEGDSIELVINATLPDSTEGTTISFLIAGLPDGSSLSSGTDHGNGCWSLTQHELDGLFFNPPEGFAGSISLNITATATHGATGATASSTESLILNYTAGDNFLSGDGAANTLMGGSGNDQITGLAGDDVIVGGIGNDTLTGGDGTDTFVFSQGDTGTDVITDFNVAQGDTLSLADLLSGVDEVFGSGESLDTLLDFNLVGNDTLVEVDVDTDGNTDQSIRLEGVDLVTSANDIAFTDVQIIDNLLVGSNLEVA